VSHGNDSLLHLTINVRKSHRQPECTSQLVCEDRFAVRLSWSWRVFLRAAVSKISTISSSLVSNHSFVHNALYQPHKPSDGIRCGDSINSFGNHAEPDIFIWSFFSPLIMTVTVTSQYIGLSFWITLCVKRWRFISCGISRRRFGIMVLISTRLRWPRRIFLALKMKTLWSVQTPRTVYQQAWLLVPVGLNLQQRCCVKLRSRKTVSVLASSVLFCGSVIVDMCNIAIDRFCFFRCFRKIAKSNY